MEAVMMAACFPAGILIAPSSTTTTGTVNVLPVVPTVGWAMVSAIRAATAPRAITTGVTVSVPLVVRMDGRAMAFAMPPATTPLVIMMGTIAAGMVSAFRMKIA